MTLEERSFPTEVNPLCWIAIGERKLLQLLWISGSLNSSCLKNAIKLTKLRLSALLQVAFTFISKHFSISVLGGGSKNNLWTTEKIPVKNRSFLFYFCIELQAFKWASQRIIVPENTDESPYVPFLHQHNVFPVFFLSE